MKAMRACVILAAALSFAATENVAAFDIEAHRGGRALFPENTLPAFANALSIGVDTLELDMGVTQDGVIVVSHDRRLNPDLARTADGAYVAPPGTPFVRLPLAEIKKYDVGQIRPGSVYAAQFPDQRAVPGTPIPTLAEVFGLVRKSGDGHVRLNIETKIDPNHPDESPDPERFVALVLGFLEAENFSDRVMISVFRLAHVADRPEIGAPDTDRIFEPAGGFCADGLSRQAVAMDGRVQPGRAWKVAAAHDKGRRRRDLVTILWRCRPSRHR